MSASCAAAAAAAAAANGDEVSTLDFFEGPEKLLECWFKKQTTSSSLRQVKRDEWTSLLELVKCTVLSVCSNEYCDAYVLSESSMFVYDTKFILKTCGTTTLLPALPRLLEIARDVGLTEIDDLFYSRKNFTQPLQQMFPHCYFDDEVKYLDELVSGAAYVLGRLNGDSWYLYTLDKPDRLPAGSLAPKPDQTIEILMTHLDEGQMKAFFYNDPSRDAKTTTKISGIADLLPGATTDEFVFDPCGYSVNGLLDNTYFTIHVTPQIECSYVSFETNCQSSTYDELINKVLRIFQPGRFTITVFANSTAICGDAVSAYRDDSIVGYSRQDKQYYQFQQYNLTFGHFCRDKVAFIRNGAEKTLQ